MKTRVAVTKMHGARNDFIIVDARSVSLEDHRHFAVEMCDRNSGIGADGLLLLERSNGADVKMRVINADGSEAEMCGNGVRCVARYIDEQTPAPAVRVETLAGVIEAEIVSRGETYQVRVRMGTPQNQGTGGFGSDAAVISVGNPHLVRFRAAEQEMDVEREGEALQHHAAFPTGVNLHAVRVLDDHTLEARHYERGAGLTMACGTGAVASAAAAIARNAVKTPVSVRVPGGELLVEWDGKGDAFMTGPAVHVFDTEVAARIPEPK